MNVQLMAFARRYGRAPVGTSLPFYREYVKLYNSLDSMKRNHPSMAPHVKAVINWLKLGSTKLASDHIEVVKDLLAKLEFKLSYETSQEILQEWNTIQTLLQDLNEKLP